MIKCVDHIAIQTNDFDVTFDFYNRVLGFSIVKEPFNFKNRRLCYLSAGNISIELYSIKEGSKSASAYEGNRGGLDHVAFVVDDIETEIKKLQQEGFRIIKPPFYPPTNEINQPRIAFIEGPDKQEIEIREIKIE